MKTAPMAAPHKSDIRPADIADLRQILNHNLKIRCVFPSTDESQIFDIHKEEISTRCMLEKKDGEKSKSNKDNLDDIIVRIRSLEGGEELKQSILNGMEVISKALSSSISIERLPAQPDGPSLSEMRLSGRPHPGLSKILRLFASDSHTFMVHTYSKHSLLSVSRFHASTTLSSGTLGNTTGLGCKDLRLRFIIYQLLHAVCFVHQADLCLESLLPCNFRLDDDMWLSTSIGLSNRMLRLLTPRGALTTPRLLAPAVPRPIDYYEPLCIQWISGKISNLEYLMAINYGAGRTMTDPLYHPLIPWVTDFSTNCLERSELPSYRDLRMTKFRLSKGDTQLETTYRHSDPPHHVPESLSELTYYIYMARRTPLHILRKVVRDVFVPEHYPQSMHRIYEWTPDECIPEFFLDPSVFHSNHSNLGLMDLELPEFAHTPQEFVAYHRAVLESDWISSQLHHWIDLTFGYCLDGEAAVQNMNVPLRHTLTSSERMGLDTPNVNKNPGFVMLFDRPHPPKALRNYKAKSHIFSYRNTRERTGSFDELNPLYFLDNSSKYSIDPSEVGTHNDGFDFRSFIGDAADLSVGSGGRPGAGAANLPASLRLQQALRDSSVLVPRDTVAQALFEESRTNTTFQLATLAPSRRSRKSLIKPSTDPSLSKLKVAYPIPLSSEDDRCKAAVSNIMGQELHYAFATAVGASLEGAYELPSVSEETKPVKAKNRKQLWDDEFVRSTERLTNYLQHQQQGPMTEAESLQAEDMFAVGCMIAELYVGHPLLSSNDALMMSVAADQREAMDVVYRATSGLPLVMRRLVTLLVHPNPLTRPKAIEVLKTCFTPADHESKRYETVYDRELTSSLRHSAFGESVYRIPTVVESSDGDARTTRFDYSHTGMSFLRLELLEDYCLGMFPSYFRAVYSLVGAVKMASSQLTRLYVLIRNVNAIQSMPLEGVHLALFHVLDVIGDSSAFLDGDGSECAGSESAAMEGFVLANYWRIIDTIGLRLGIEGTEKLLVPQLLRFLNNFRSSDCLQALLRSCLWTVVALRAGVRCFLRNFLPQLLTFVSAGTLFNVFLREKGGKRTENAPLWATPDSAVEKSDWLRSSNPDAIAAVQTAAVAALRELTEPHSLGSGVVARYILPSLLSLIGVPQLALNDFENSDPVSEGAAERLFADVVAASVTARQPLTDGDRPSIDEIVRGGQESRSRDSSSHAPPFSASSTPPPYLEGKEKETLERHVIIQATFRAEDMYVIRAVVDISSRLGELVTSELVLATIFNVTVPDLEAQLTASVVKPGLAAAIMEVIVLLTNLLPSLSTQVVHHDILQPSRISECCLPRLLSSWPLTATWSFFDDMPDNMLESTSLDKCIESVRLHMVLAELCRLIVSASMIAGADACGEFVLPHVDIFFKNFVAAFGMVPVESRTMMKAFELGASLYVPLVQLMGPEAFYTAVPNVNPRLDMWLSSIGSHVPLRSPPLPSNIWPEVTSEVTNQPEKKKGIMQWISGRSRWLTSSSSSAPTPNHGVATPAAIVSTAAPSSSYRAAPSFPPPPPPPPVALSFTSPLPPARHACGEDSAVPSSATVLALAQTKRKEETHRTPHRISALLHRTPAKDPHNIFTPTEGTELVELDNEADETNFVTRMGNVVNTPPDPAHAVPTATAVAENFEGHNAAVLASEVRLDILRDDSPQQHDGVTRVHHLDEEDSDDDDLEDYQRSMGGDPERDREDQRYSTTELDAELEEPVLPQPLPALLSTSRVAAVAEGDVGADAAEIVAVAVESSTPSSSITDTVIAVREAAPADNVKRYSIADGLRDDLMSPQKSAAEEDAENPFTNYTRLIQMRAQARNAHSSSSQFHKKKMLSLHGGGGTGSGGGGGGGGGFGGGGGSSGLGLSSSNAGAGGNGTAVKRTSTKMTSMLYASEAQESPEEVESREMRFSEMTWLLAGNGRWNIDKEVKDKSTKEQNKLLKGTKNSTIYYTNGFDWNPAAQMSMTAPKIAVDVASDASSWINFQYQSHTQFKLEDSPGLIRCMVANPSESLLMTCSRTGVRLWSLTSHPLLHISSYTRHSMAPFSAAFLRDGQHAVTCDGTIHLWDIETRHRLDLITPTHVSSAMDKTAAFSSMSVVSSKFGVNPSLGEIGDEQLLATLQDSLYFYDIRCRSHAHHSLLPVAQWTMPQLPPPQSNFISSVAEPLQLTCAASHEHYTYAGSATGGMWVVDRRTGRTLQSWQAHDGPILKIHPLSERHVLAISDRSAAVWEYSLDQHDLSMHWNSISYDPSSFRDYTSITERSRDLFHPTAAAAAASSSSKDREVFHTGLGGVGEFRRVLSIKNTTSDGVYSASNIILSSFDNFSGAASSGGGSAAMSSLKYTALDKELGLSCKPQHILYCLAGHKMHSAFLPSFDQAARDRDRVNIGGGVGGGGLHSAEMEELRLTQHYFYDRKGSKLARGKMQITSAALLPLRRLLLLGTEEGLVRIIS